MMASNRRPSARNAISELGMLQPHPQPQPKKPSVPTPVDEPAPERPLKGAEPPVAKRKPPSRPVSPAPTAAPAMPRVKTEVNLPEDVVTAARGRLRPQHTGHRRTLGAPLLLQAYVQVIHDLDLDVDVHGLEPTSLDETVVRVRDALEAWKNS